MQSQLKMLNNSDSPTYVAVFKVVEKGWLFNTYQRVDDDIAEIPAGEEFYWPIYRQREYARYLYYSKVKKSLATNVMACCVKAERVALNDVKDVILTVQLGKDLGAEARKKIRLARSNSQVKEYNEDQVRAGIINIIASLNLDPEVCQACLTALKRLRILDDFDDLLGMPYGIVLGELARKFDDNPLLNPLLLKACDAYFDALNYLLENEELPNQNFIGPSLNFIGPSWLKIKNSCGIRLFIRICTVSERSRKIKADAKKRNAIAVEPYHTIHLLVLPKCVNHRYICYSKKWDFFCSDSDKEVKWTEFYDLEFEDPIEISDSISEDKICQLSAQHIIDSAKKNPKVALLETFSGLCEEELSFLEEREEVTKPAIWEIIEKGIKINDYGALDLDILQGSQTALQTALRWRKLPRIAVCFSGGGARAMLSTLGFLQGLQSEGLLDAISYASALSGSTWCLTKCLEQCGTENYLGKVKEYLTDRLAEGIIPKTIWEKGAFGIDVLFNPGKHPEFAACHYAVSNNVPGFTNAYGMLLGRFLYNNRDDMLTFPLSSLAENANKASMPLLICTAIERIENDSPPQPGSYRWFELTPFTVGEIGKYKEDNGCWAWLYSKIFGRRYEVCAIPAWALGRKFQRNATGKIISVKQSPKHFSRDEVSDKLTSEYYSPEPPVSQLVGAYGSAFTLSVDEAIEQRSLPPRNAKLFTKGTNCMEIGTKLVSKGAYNLDLSSVNLIEGLKINNFIDPSPGKETIELRDAGLDFNLPMPPLFNLHRNINMMIILDTSGDLHDESYVGDALKKFRAYANYHGFPLSEDFKNKLNDKIEQAKRDNVVVIGDPDNKSEMVIIYVPTIQNESLLIHSNLKPTEKFGTFKMEYTKRESEALIEYSEHLARNIAQTIKRTIYQRTKAMNK